MLKDSSSGYGLITILFHWICASLIIFLFGLGVYMRSLDYYSPWYHRGPALHIALGMFVFVLMLVRLLWRSSNQQPAHLPDVSAIQYRAAFLSKVALYIFVFVICITGYLITTAEGDSADFFELFKLPATLHLSASNVDRAGFIHKYLAWSLIGVALIHGGAALFHHFIKRDKTLVRMLKPAAKAE